MSASRTWSSRARRGLSRCWCMVVSCHQRVSPASTALRAASRTSPKSRRGRADEDGPQEASRLGRRPIAGRQPLLLVLPWAGRAAALSLARRLGSKSLRPLSGRLLHWPATPLDDPGCVARRDVAGRRSINWATHDSRRQESELADPPSSLRPNLQVVRLGLCQSPRSSGSSSSSAGLSRSRSGQSPVSR